MPSLGLFVFPALNTEDPGKAYPWASKESATRRVSRMGRAADGRRKLGARTGRTRRRRDLFGVAGQHSPWMTWVDLLQADPDIIVLMPCGFDIPRTTAELHWLTERPEWPTLSAVRNRRVYIADGNQYFNRPGPRLVESTKSSPKYSIPIR